jgi:3-hydroxybutyryl-CoA dehydratase
MTDLPGGLTRGERIVHTKTVSETDVYLFAGITGDFHPNHTNETYMQGTQFGRRIAHGALLVGLVSAATAKLFDRLTPPGYVSQEYSIKFLAPVFLGDTVTVTLQLTEYLADRRKLLFDARCTNQHGTIVAQGTAVLKLLRPGGPGTAPGG